MLNEAIRILSSIMETLGEKTNRLKLFVFSILLLSVALLKGGRWTETVYSLRWPEQKELFMTGVDTICVLYLPKLA